jgi:hypothetical protein
MKLYWGPGTHVWLGAYYAEIVDIWHSNGAVQGVVYVQLSHSLTYYPIERLRA